MDPKSIERESGRLVHQILAHSYILYLGAIILGFAIDIASPTTAFSFPLLIPLGLVLILAGTALAFWAQHSAKKGSAKRNSETEKICRDHFCVGPYVFTRTPTQYSLFMMAIGLGFLYGSLAIVILSLVAFFVGRFVFIPKQEHHLAKKYGDAYLEYKKIVKF